VKEMLKEVQEVKVGGRRQRVQVRPFAWNARMLLTLPAFVVLFIAGCGRGAATDTSPQVAEGSGVWREFAPGGNGGGPILGSGNPTPPFFTGGI
jgi:hypothetical protein